MNSDIASHIRCIFKEDCNSKWIKSLFTDLWGKPSHLLACLLTRPCRHQLQREAWQHYLPVKLSLTFLCHVDYYVYINVYYPQHNVIYLYTCLSHSPHSSQHPLTSTPLHSHEYNLLCLTLDTKTFSQSPVRGCVVFLNQYNGVICPTQDKYISREPLLHLSLFHSLMSHIWEIRL